MFIRVALLLLLAYAVLIESSKIHDILKKIGKRLPKKDNTELGLLETIVNDVDAYNRLSEEEQHKRKLETAEGMMHLFTRVSSNYHGDFNKAFTIIESLLEPDMTAEICGDGKNLNSYQFMKHLRQSSTLYYGRFVQSDYFDIFKTDRDTLHMITNFTQTDKNGLKVVFEYDIKMKTTYTTSYIFSITHVTQGGSCADNGLASFSNPELEGVDWMVDDIKELQTKPSAKLFFKLFTPSVVQNFEENANMIPKQWMGGINSSVTKITVCQEKIPDSVEYTEEAFRSWYLQFRLMWHPKKGAEDTYTLQILELKPDSIIARVTMKLQMGRKEDAPVHDWNFKFSGKNISGTWNFERIEVLCNPTVEYKDQSLNFIREVVARKFGDDLKDRNNTEWYSTVAFIKDFTKHNNFEMTDCIKDTVQKITLYDLFKKDQDDVHGIKFTKYYIEEENIEFPAPDTATFRFKTASKPADASADQTEEKEHEWTFDIKWDQMDQFYYIEKMGIGCEKKWSFMGTVQNIFGR
ncbi:hypothetical protein GCK72_006824 [Caenorhabditis remanei]|uniref:NTF2-like domain-containing protein n=1 Tax=Caenorhabditis remanei TaxID=31234 RepID=A0A6A5HJK4_CAERE|nr:hypothetical protein GCK72_006824 [Caenorhabditis remanei]KAF1766866.1 hypothetical protein GCK72_006824 [Caenorhabditis remanei]